jgi:hypothetical protein
MTKIKLSSLVIDTKRGGQFELIIRGQLYKLFFFYGDACFVLLVMPAVTDSRFDVCI